jgi:hypothetical protein
VLRLNPIIRGWANYYSTGVSKTAFSTLDHLIWQRITRWCKRRHLNKSAQWVNSKYFRTVGDRNWVFSDGTYPLTTHAETPIVRHTRVRGNKSPYDGDSPYWAARLGKHPLLPTSVSKLLKAQKGVRPLLDTFRAQWKHRIDSVCSRIDPNGLRLRLTLSNSELRRLLSPSTASRNHTTVA